MSRGNTGNGAVSTSSLPALRTPSPKWPVLLNETVHTEAMFDSGSESCVMQKSFFLDKIQHLGRNPFQGRECEMELKNGADGTNVDILKIVPVTFRMGEVAVHDFPFCVLPDSPVPHPSVTIGWNLIKQLWKDFLDEQGQEKGRNLLNNFFKPPDYPPVLFSAVCTYHYGRFFKRQKKVGPLTKCDVLRS